MVSSYPARLSIRDVGKNYLQNLRDFYCHVLNIM
jgi:hypothetical protein